MPLQFSGRTQLRTDGSTGVHATDAQTNKNVVVRVAQEVLDHKTLQQATVVAERKYDAGNLEADGSVFVRSADF